MEEVGGSVLANVYNNKNFNALPVDQPMLQAALTDFTASIAATVQGGSQATNEKNKKKHELVAANFTDANAQDTHTCTFSWGDGVTVPGAVTEPTTNSSGECQAMHIYAGAGVYTVGITVTDNLGANASATFEYIVVYDPAAGFVTGSGWVNSGAGAYVSNPTLTGKATFGFVSKYQQGANTPTGLTEFEFNMANLNFRSKVCEWLVVSGAKAQYKGTGTINGTGDYGFLLTATDGELPGGRGVDRFRIKIWDKVTNGVVYDNVGGSDDINSTDPQVISGGSIVIHTQ